MILANEHAPAQPLIIFRSAQWPVFLNTLRAAKEKYPENPVDVLAQPEAVDTVKEFGLAREVIAAKSRWFTFKSVDVPSLKAKGYRMAVVPVSDRFAEGYFTVFALAWLMAKEAYWSHSKGGFEPITIAVLLDLLTRSARRWILTVLSLLVLPAALILAVMTRLVHRRGRYQLLYIANDSWQDPLVLSHSLAWIKKTGQRAVFASFEGRIELNANIPFPLDDAVRIESRFDPNMHRMLICALPKLTLAAAIHGVRTTHARSYGPAFIAAILKKTLGLRFVFDTRGAWMEENILSGYYNTRPISRNLDMAMTRAAFGCADHVIAVGEAHAALLSKNYEMPRPPVIITCSVDTDHYAKAAELRDVYREKLGFSGMRVAGYSGSAVHYQSPELVARLMAQLTAQDPDTRGLILSQDAAWFESLLRMSGADPARVRLMSPQRDELAAYTSCMDCALLLRKPAEAIDIGLPSKFAEYLAAGVPALASGNQIDVARILNQRDAGVLCDWDSLSVKTLAGALKTFTDDRAGYSARCMKAAADIFNIGNYSGVIKKLWDTDS
ncbi:MAG: glycosyltransferase [Nitrospinae bacterium]|nr:glycosyltransferase [Nitrospinota bacterium]